MYIFFNKKEISQEYRVLLNVTFLYFDKEENIYHFRFRDLINLIKEGELVGVYEINNEDG